MFWFGNPFLGNVKSNSSYKNKREADKLYYKDHVLDAEKTPRQLLTKFPELSPYLPMLIWYGMADATIDAIISANGLAKTQDFIDNMTK